MQQGILTEEKIPKVDQGWESQPKGCKACGNEASLTLTTLINTHWMGEKTKMVS